MGPVEATPTHSLDVGPHPHCGLQTVTWLTQGQILHHDSLGSEQLIRPGQLNLMTAGGGVAHAEEPTDQYRGALHAIQLWVAQPDSTRMGRPAFEHHANLPEVDLGGAAGVVLIGELAGISSLARRDTDHMGAEIAMPGGTVTVPLRSDYEHALIVLEGAVVVDGDELRPGHLGYVTIGRDEIGITAPAPARVMLLGGVPFAWPIHMWWNFVARSRSDIEAARRDWESESDRFGSVTSKLDRIPAPRLPWTVSS
jgi:redox-sensitive bicupin YhaK (pirin superfamily)